MSVKKIDLQSYPRRQQYEFYRQFREPFWGVTVALDARQAYTRRKGLPGSFYAQYLHACLGAVNRVPEFRQRILEDELVEFERVHCSATVFRPDHTFGFAIIEYEPELGRFVQGFELATAEARAADHFLPNQTSDLIHFSAIPWFSFSSLSHARLLDGLDSVPKFSIGKLTPELTLPVSVHAHHALVDGYHVGLLLRAFQELLDGG